MSASRAEQVVLIQTLRHLLDHIEPIATDKSGRVHVLLTVEPHALDRAFELAGDEEDQDTGDAEPSLGSSGDIDQTGWSAGNCLDLEHGAAVEGLGGDCDDDEPHELAG